MARSNRNVTLLALLTAIAVGLYPPWQARTPILLPRWWRSRDNFPRLNPDACTMPRGMFAPSCLSSLRTAHSLDNFWSWLEYMLRDRYFVNSLTRCVPARKVVES